MSEMHLRGPKPRCQQNSFLLESPGRIVSPSFIKKYLLSIYSVPDSCQRLVGQSSHIPEGEHEKLIGKEFVVYNTRKGPDEEMSQTCGDNSEQTGGKQWEMS